jgi:Uma2 family endonuclease
MATLTAPATRISVVPTELDSLGVPFLKLTREQVRAMEQHGIIYESSRIELLDGVLLEKEMPSPPHEAVSRRLNKHLSRLLPDDWFYQGNTSLDLAESEPIPDGAVVRGTIEDYDHAHPDAAATGIAIEISVSTLRFDRNFKLAKYASTGVPVYWIINLNDRQIEVFTDPETFKSPANYATQAVYKPGDRVPIVLDGVAVADVAVDDLLPK